MVNECRRRNVVILAAGLRKLETEIQVLRIHEVLLAEPSNFFEEVAVEHQASPGDNLNLRGKALAGEEWRHSPQAGPWGASAQKLTVEGLIEHGGKGLDTTCLERAVGV